MSLRRVHILCQTLLPPRLKAFSYTGDLIRSIFTHVDLGMYVDSPSFFCLDAKSDLLLIDYLYYQIKIFSKEGALLHTFVNSGYEVGMFAIPQGIALTNNQKLIIVYMNTNYCMQIFS